MVPTAPTHAPRNHFLSPQFCINGEKTLCPGGSYGNTTGLSAPNCTGTCDDGFVCRPGSTTPNDAAGTCLAGYYCPSRSSSTERECGDPAHFCPAASTSPLQVRAGFYSSPLEVPGTVRQSELPCEDGFRCVDGVRTECSSENSGEGNDNVYCLNGQLQRVDTGSYSSGGVSGLRTGQQTCEEGHWCNNGRRFLCPMGTYGSTTGLVDATCSGNCTLVIIC